MKSLIVNLFGAPGSGKSTGAAYIFSYLKMKGINAELVTEYAKDKTWENNLAALSCQPYIFGNQLYALERCSDKVDAIITDSPVLLSVIYDAKHGNKTFGKSFTDFVTDTHKKHDSLNFFITRDKPYNITGRNESSEESDSISTEIIDLLKQTNTPFVEVNGNEDGYNFIARTICEELKRRKINGQN